MKRSINKSVKLFSVLAAIALVCSAAKINQATAVSGNVKTNAPEAIPGELIIKLKDQSMGIHSLQSQLTNLGVQIASVEPFETDARYQLIKVENPADTETAIKKLEDLSSIEYAEPNYVVRVIGSEDGLSNMPNDPEFTKLWGLQNTGQADSANQIGTVGADIDVTKAWDMGITGSKNIVVAVIDTGVDYTHPDLVDNIYINKNEIADNGIDDDANGFIDDTIGWNFFANNKNAMDDHNHGTHCAGTIGGSGNNSVGVVGVNWNVSILPIKFLGGNGSGSIQGAVNSIKYATKMGVNIMSNSWGGSGFSQALKDAIVEAESKGILFVAAAGNDSKDLGVEPTYPASFEVPNVLTVAATDNQDNIATFSNYSGTKVHIAAPGVRIWSTVRIQPNKPEYASFSGTSMATPHAAGAAALLLSAFPNMNYNEIKTRLISTSDQMVGLKRKVIAKGRINIANAITNTVPPSLEPPESAWKDVQLAVLPESVHPYTANLNLVFPVQATGAKMMRIVFEQIDTESGYDMVKIETGAGALLETLQGTLVNHVTEIATTDSLNIRLTTDNSVHKWGFKVAKVQAIY